MSKINPPNEPIAIIGVGCRFPGACDSPSKLWDLLKRPRDVQQPIPEERFNAKSFFNENGLYHGNSNVLHAYTLSEDIKTFDAQFFGINAVEASAMDPQQRMLLETVYEAVDSAGLKVSELQGTNVGVYVGLMCNDYESMLLRDLDTMPTYHATGIGRSIMSNRISYFFDWTGPSMTLDTACSSSLIALHEAVQLLRQGHTRLAVAAGTNLILGPENFIGESKLKMLSPTGRSRMWDADADGYARGEGVAAVILKPLSLAIADGDNIECVVRETGINQDGKSQGITHPSSIAQANLIRDVYLRAGLDLTDPRDRPQFFEAHGTGTPAGDPIEAAAIASAFYSGTEDLPIQPLYCGSIKTVIGHTEGTWYQQR
jgi:hybrid polyketide synthase/nonribosomal peptide synthetase ACE1